MAVEPQARANIDKTIAEVRAAQRRGIAELKSRWLGGEAAANGVKALEALTGRINEWADSGSKAAASGTPPGANGWKGWINSGQLFIDGMNDIVGTVLSEPLALFTVAGVAVDAAQATEKAAKTVAKKGAAVAKAVAAETAEVASTLTKPLLLPLLLVVVGIVAIAAMKFAPRSK